ncbi:MAG: prolipoprotein diacylglyceryl transferase [Elusimicrobia bacterium]|nr:prolipoprotein diacylglyceryl transferase [Elusimicrobiota bacterium]
MRPILFQLGPLKVYGYGVMIVLGGILGFWFLSRRGKKAGIRSDDDFWLLVNVILVSGFVGGRVLFLFQYTAPFSAQFWRTLISPSEGFSVFGAFAGVPLGIWLFCRWKKIPFVRLLDNICVMAPLWHVFGRAGCLLAGCCYGIPTKEPWGIVFTDPRAMVPKAWLGVPLQPTEPFEMVGNALIALVLYQVLKRTETRRPGLVAAGYFAAYGTMRFVEEYWRGDTVTGWLGMTSGQNLGVGLLLAAAALLTWRSLCIRSS